MSEAQTSPALPAGYVQRVLPAGAARETRWVLITVALVLVLSAFVVSWQRHMQQEMTLQTHQIDLATGLSAAEQGIYTDLQAVFDEWRSLGGALPPPAPQWWADEGWPPFDADLAAQRRGSRQWRVVQAEGLYAYLGVAAASDESAATHRPMLWRLPNLKGAKTQDAESRFDVWLRTGPDAAPEPAGLHDDDLIAHGWQQVAAHASDVKPKH